MAIITNRALIPSTPQALDFNDLVTFTTSASDTSLKLKVDFFLFSQIL